jgi:hypothetical protein
MGEPMSTDTRSRISYAALLTGISLMIGVGGTLLAIGGDRGTALEKISYTERRMDAMEHEMRRIRAEMLEDTKAINLKLSRVEQSLSRIEGRLERNTP